MATQIVFKILILLTSFTYVTASMDTNCSVYYESGLNMSIPEDYNKLIPDFGIYGEKPFVVDYIFFLDQIHAVKDKEGFLDLSLYLNINWRDDRLIKDNCSKLFDKQYLNRIWVPDFFITTVKTIKSYNADYEDLNILAADNGRFWWTLHLDVRLNCAFDFTWYPFDHQVCNFWLTSQTFVQGLRVTQK